MTYHRVYMILLSTLTLKTLGGAFEVLKASNWTFRVVTVVLVRRSLSVVLLKE